MDAKLTRREFVRDTAVTAAGVAALGVGVAEGAAFPEQPDTVATKNSSATTASVAFFICFAETLG